MVLDEFAQQASRSIRVHHASFDCDAPCHCIAFADMVRLGSNILYHFSVYVYILYTQVFFSIYLCMIAYTYTYD